ncbi:hypothetical protein GGR55DRAFT_153045 [Xylaria sp. FL0064]|nr:hypothetical protein GGR55DRAFT_153045 [Xylaria sp. FL0064]
MHLVKNGSLHQVLALCISMSCNAVSMSRIPIEHLALGYSGPPISVFPQDNIKKSSTPLLTDMSLCRFFYRVSHTLSLVSSFVRSLSLSWIIRLCRAPVHVVFHLAMIVGWLHNARTRNYL